jgi:hypothetical protein
LRGFASARSVGRIIDRAVIGFAQNETRSGETAPSEGQTAPRIEGDPGCGIIDKRKQSLRLLLSAQPPPG